MHFNLIDPVLKKSPGNYILCKFITKEKPSWLVCKMIKHRCLITSSWIVVVSKRKVKPAAQKPGIINLDF